MPEKETYSDLPKATVKRLPQYYRLFKKLVDDKIMRTNSREISEKIGVDSATVRRDFSLFGELGRRGYGYDSLSLRDFFANLLGNEVSTNIALIGVGNLGRALLNYPFQRRNKLHIAMAFDLPSNPLVGTKSESGIPIYNIGELAQRLCDSDIETAILSVDTVHSQDVANILVNTGIKGILNFTPVYLQVPDNIVVQSIDLTKELQTLIFFMNNASQL
ncbi:redox-sensing transcriptional repressor Rex [Lactovum miscens]|uniref:Redox-sensing transcriptional repressor Rex n=1 Tax=Lactovum miscens TaxID=190387 RepID=A0A841C8W5_9LACT|nr:redox-sensing transcriptional repressor Rex [Lactovum miscens]MBB5888747.1 redox-sensing transcriptional repressor [Lactovum miscens]